MYFFHDDVQVNWNKGATNIFTSILYIPYQVRMTVTQTKITNLKMLEHVS